MGREQYNVRQGAPVELPVRLQMLIARMRRGPEPAYYEVDAGELLAYTDEGLTHLRSGAYREAQRHFTDHVRAQVRGIQVNVETYMVRSLLHPLDVIQAVHALLPGAQHRAHDIYLPDVWPVPLFDSKTGQEQTFMSLPDQYRPDLVTAFEREVATLQAEAWLRLVRAETGRPLAGQEDVDADTAAYLSAAVPLSPDFLTRSEARMAWCLSLHPERQAELALYARIGQGL